MGAPNGFEYWNGIEPIRSLGGRRSANGFEYWNGIEPPLALVTRTLQPSAALVGAGTLTATGRTAKAATATLVGVSMLSATAGAARAARAALAGTSTVVAWASLHFGVLGAGDGRTRVVGSDGRDDAV